MKKSLLVIALATLLAPLDSSLAGEEDRASNCRSQAAMFFNSTRISLDHESRSDDGYVISGQARLERPTRTEQFRCYFGSKRSQLIDFYAHGEMQMGEKNKKDSRK